MLKQLLAQPVTCDVHLQDLTSEAVSALSVDELREVHKRIHRAALLDDDFLQSPQADDAALLNLLVQQELWLRGEVSPVSVQPLNERSRSLGLRQGLTEAHLRFMGLVADLPAQPSLPETDSDVELVQRQVSLCPVRRAEAEQRIVFGIVYEPNVPDAYGTWASAEEIAKWAHLWLARFQNNTDGHTRFVNDKVEIYESYIAPVDFKIGGRSITKGTWLLMMHVRDDEMWDSIKRGDLTGFSIGAYASVIWGKEPPTQSP